MARLTVDALRTLLAIGWIDGELAPAEVQAVRAVARRLAFGPADLERLEEAIRAPVPLGDPGALDAEQRMLLYALARWIVHVDGRVTDEESDVLHVAALSFGIGGRGRRALDALVDDLLAGGPAEPSAFDADRLAARVRELLG